MNYLVIVVEGGFVQEVLPYINKQPAIEESERRADDMDPEADDVVVWDAKTNKKIYDALAEDEDDEDEDDEDEDDEEEETEESNEPTEEEKSP
ncbi:MAG: hypothetical protein ACREDF_02675 [Thermoplasmata archaeon]